MALNIKFGISNVQTYNHNILLNDVTCAQIKNLITWCDDRDGITLIFRSEEAYVSWALYIDEHLDSSITSFFRLFYDDDAHPDVVEFKLTWL